MRYRFVIAVEAETLDQAKRVVAERLDHDEDYGFPYQIEWYRMSFPKEDPPTSPP
jgi:hypothetical protein